MGGLLNVAKKPVTMGLASINPVAGALGSGAMDLFGGAMSGDDPLLTLMNAGQSAGEGYGGGIAAPFDVYEAFGLPDFRKKA